MLFWQQGEKDALKSSILISCSIHAALAFFLVVVSRVDQKKAPSETVFVTFAGTAKVGEDFLGGTSSGGDKKGSSARKNKLSAPSKTIKSSKVPQATKKNLTQKSAMASASLPVLKTSFVANTTKKNKSKKERLKKMPTSQQSHVGKLSQVSSVKDNAPQSSESVITKDRKYESPVIKKDNISESQGDKVIKKEDKESKKSQEKGEAVEAVEEFPHDGGDRVGDEHIAFAEQREEGIVLSVVDKAVINQQLGDLVMSIVGVPKGTAVLVEISVKPSGETKCVAVIKSSGIRIFDTMVKRGLMNMTWPKKLCGTTFKSIIS